jgi:hypothetical protein
MKMNVLMLPKIMTKQSVFSILCMKAFLVCSYVHAMELPPTVVSPNGIHIIQSAESSMTQAALGLFEASLHDDPAAIRTALRMGAHIETKSSEGKTALYMAASCGKSMALAALLAEGADPETQCTERNETALDCAFACKHHEIIEMLLLYGARATSDHIDAAMLDPFYRATVLNNDVVSGHAYLKQMMKSSDRMKLKALCYAAGRCHFDAVTRWLMFNADPTIALKLVHIIKKRSGLPPVKAKRYSEITELLERHERHKARRLNGLGSKKAS